MQISPRGKKILIVFSIISVILVGCSKNEEPSVPTVVKPTVVVPTIKVEPTPAVTNERLPSVTIHFLDVGQADSIFIDFGDTDILIDGGNNADGDFVVNYLKSLKTDDIELMVATHPHEDHIGGLDTVINNFEVESILKPDLAEITQTNKDFEMAISNKNIPTENPEQGTIIEYEDLKFIVLSNKTKKYSDTNNFSIVLKMIYGDTSFLFTGDAEADVEHDIIDSGFDLKADVFKVGHHGSASSTTANFLNKIKPDYAIISVGADNKYGHPDSIIIKRLSLHDVATMRTDEMGTIIFTSDGKNLSFETKKAEQNITPTPTIKIEPTVTPAPTLASTEKSEKTPVFISGLDKKAEYVEITNKSSKEIELTGWSLVSVTGNQKYNFPDGYIIKAGAKIKVVSYQGTGELVWTTSNVWNNSKSDPAELYDENGKLVSKWDD